MAGAGWWAMISSGGGHAVQLGQVQVHDDDVGLGVERDADRLASVARLADDVVAGGGLQQGP